MRLIVKCGADALRDYREKYKSVLEISNLLSAKQPEVSLSVVKLNEQLSAEKAAAAALKKRLIAEKAAGFAPDTDKTAVFENGLDIKELQLLADALCKKAAAYAALFRERTVLFPLQYAAKKPRSETFLRNSRPRLIHAAAAGTA